MATKKKITKKELLEIHKAGRSERGKKQDLATKAKKSGTRKVTKEGETSNQYGTFKNKVGSSYSETRPNRSDVGRKQKKQRI